MGWVDSLSGKIVGLDTALTMQAAFFLTNDKHLPSLPNLKILMLDDLVKEG